MAFVKGPTFIKTKYKCQAVKDARWSAAFNVP